MLTYSGKNSSPAKRREGEGIIFIGVLISEFLNFFVYMQQPHFLMINLPRFLFPGIEVLLVRPLFAS